MPSDFPWNRCIGNLRRFCHQNSATRKPRIPYKCKFPQNTRFSGWLIKSSQFRSLSSYSSTQPRIAHTTTCFNKVLIYNNLKQPKISFHNIFDFNCVLDIMIQEYLKMLPMLPSSLWY